MKIVRPITITDIGLTTSNITSPETGAPVFNGATAYAAGDRVTVETGSKTVTITIADPAIFTSAAHEYAVGDLLNFTTTGALPTGLSVGRQYVVKSVTANTYTVAETALVFKGITIRTSGSQSGTHTAVYHNHGTYVALQATTGNHPRLAASAAYWQREGSSNRWKMFDGSVSSQTTGGTISIKITFTEGPQDTLALLNISGTSCVVKIYDTAEVMYVYNQTHSLILSGITPQETASDLLLTDLPQTATGGGWLEVVLSDAVGYNMCAIGALIFGTAIDAGTTQAGIETGIQDFSVIEADEFGNYGVTERAYSKTASYKVKMALTSAPRIHRILSEQRAKKCLYIGNDTDVTTAIYGFPDDWTVIRNDDDTSALLSLSCKGLT